MEEVDAATSVANARTPYPPYVAGLHKSFETRIFRMSWTAILLQDSSAAPTVVVTVAWLHVKFGRQRAL